ncbi:MAG: efflux RND transporter periplasmic adaptor subunit [Verrucomicrobia bacterium]|nr:efflux RND transporter periplasmic adaptor subunit [Verrucomicrobiota bacterium]MDE3097991.1 efflux RND transporter periplasmic adaptor subunit [Verrucomicrobiota bacterium]
MKLLQKFTVGGAAIVPVLLACLLAGCGRHQPAFQMPPPQVGVVVVKPQTVTVTTDLPGRIDPVRIAEVRARVTGIVLEQQFKQGSEVKAGETLFQIDPAPFQAAYDSAKAAVAKARANAKQTSQLEQRYKPLVAINAVSKQDYDNAVSAADQATAALLSARADLETAKLNLGYATVTSPIDGRIGAALVTEGALVSQTAATEMAVVQQLNPVYFDFTESSAEYLHLRQEMKKGQLKSIGPGEAKVTLMLDDGSAYPHPGKLLFSDVSVDPSSGMILLRAEVPNPDHLLLPGMFVEGRFEEAVNRQALVVPQQAVMFGPSGMATVMLVNKENKVEQRDVEANTAWHNDWIISTGLEAGDRVITEGLQKVRPGMAVQPVPAGSGNPPPPQRGGPPAPGQR